MQAAFERLLVGPSGGGVHGRTSKRWHGWHGTTFQITPAQLKLPTSVCICLAPHAHRRAAALLLILLLPFPSETRSIL